MSNVVGRRAKDQIKSPIDTAVFWVQYVLRHDTAHLKPPSINQRWWRKRLLDVWFVLLVLFLTVNITIYKSIKWLMVQGTMSRYRCSKKVKLF